MRARLGATSAILAVVILSTLVTAPVARAQNDPASRAVRYLVAHEARDGSLDGSVGETEDLVLGAAAAGYDPGTLRPASGSTPLDFLAAHLTAATADAGKTAKLILALVAAGRDPAAFAGVDLLASLQGFYDPVGGRYGDGATFGQALAILALSGAAVPAVPVPAAAVTALRAAQDSDGSWNYQGTKDASVGGDTNSTAVAVMALVAAGAADTDPALARALAYLRAQQQPDGGFPYQAGAGSDPDSDALVIEALAASGQDIGTSWTKDGQSPFASLLGFQDAASGGFRYPGNAAPDPFTTSQVPQGLEALPLPVRTAFAPSAGLSTDGAHALAALRYLSGQQRPDGSLDGSPGETEDFILGTVAAGDDPATLTTCADGSAYAFLASQVAAATADAGKTAKLLLALTAGRRDPRAFGGLDVLARLASFYRPASGVVGDGATFSQALAILALRAAGQPVPAAAVVHLAALQDADGSWNYETASGATTGDTNSTAIALMALSAVGDAAPVPAALAYLHGVQGAAGGFPYQAGPGAPSDPDSDALVLQALTALHQSPVSPAWTVAAHTVLDDLRRFQAPDGGFIFPGNAAPDAFTTSEVPAALERVPLPGLAPWTPGRPVTTRACGPSHPTASGVPAATLPATSSGLPQGQDGGPDAPLLVLVAGLLGLAAGALVVPLARRAARP
ncbi:MAG TPA: prenyltransferase/squalene oxidase repeat-containing protein [Thermomicrobiaceae bacterium]|nr:prenyltransferase/squalene oxidase repeat-containing protein [Thermomicrobiaceae bacterium]